METKPKFLWYARDYYQAKRQYFPIEEDEFIDLCRQQRFFNLPLEIRVGLLNDICDDLGGEWHEQITSPNENVSLVCPEAFLASFTKRRKPPIGKIHPENMTIGEPPVNQYKAGQTNTKNYEKEKD